jgi:hypothetical protein
VEEKSLLLSLNGLEDRLHVLVLLDLSQELVELHVGVHISDSTDAVNTADDGTKHVTSLLNLLTVVEQLNLLLDTFIETLHDLVQSTENGTASPVTELG